MAFTWNDFIGGITQAGQAVSGVANAIDDIEITTDNKIGLNQDTMVKVGLGLAGLLVGAWFLFGRKKRRYGR